MGTFIALLVLYLLWRGERRALKRARLQDSLRSKTNPLDADKSHIVTLARIIIRDNSPW
ncbi:MAG: hypothetical protein Q8M98_00055 [Candidatus Cloacimonadaceae bacterium]|nr:hypothetical protein [Candidatus Cloacimonadaceae bacterium]MDP3113143.1 hypothetical protein [Candidatus Cloacimonadaceae bacterium]